MFSIIFLFNSLSELVEAENIFLGEGNTYQIEPVPSHIASECGMCIATKEEGAEVLSALLTGQGIEHCMVAKEN
jgi:hypothetical protein